MSGEEDKGRAEILGLSTIVFVSAVTSLVYTIAFGYKRLSSKSVFGGANPNSKSASAGFYEWFALARKITAEDCKRNAGLALAASKLLDLSRRTILRLIDDGWCLTDF